MLGIGAGASYSVRADAIPRPILIQSEVSPQINPTDLIIGRQAVWGPALEDAPRVHDIRPVGDAQRLANVVVGDEDTNPAGFQVKDDFLDVGDSDWVDAGKRFIEQDE